MTGTRDDRSIFLRHVDELMGFLWDHARDGGTCIRGSEGLNFAFSVLQAIEAMAEYLKMRISD